MAIKPISVTIIENFKVGSLQWKELTLLSSSMLFKIYQIKSQLF